MFLFPSSLPFCVEIGLAEACEHPSVRSAREELSSARREGASG